MSEPSMPRRFDLACKGVTVVKRRNQKEFAQVLHVDLDLGLYAISGSGTASRILSQDSDRIVFRNVPSDGYVLRDEAWWVPSSGEYEERYTATRRIFHESETHADATVSDYSGPKDLSSLTRLTSLSDVVVRPAADSDAPALAELLNAIIARGGTTALEQSFTPERLARKYLTGPNVISSFVAYDSETGEALGFQILTREAYVPENWGDIGTFARVGGTQRGVGSALFAATCERARELGLAGLNAQIRADNHGGLAFYSRMGFQDHHVDAAVPLADGTPVDRITKRYPLQAETSAPSVEQISLSTP